MAERTARRPRRPARDAAPEPEEGYDADAEETGSSRSSRPSRSRPARRAAPKSTDAEPDDGGSDDGDDDEGGSRRGRRENGVKGGWGTWRQKKAESSDFADDFKVEYKERYLVLFLDESPFAAFAEHWIDEMPSGQKKSWNCIGKGCPLCDVLGDKPKAKAMFNVLQFVEEEDGKRVPYHKVWTVGSGIAGDLEELSEDPGLEGNYFRVRKTKADRKGPTTYHIEPVKDRDVEEDWNTDLLSDEAYDEWMTKKFDSGYVTMPTRKKLQEIAEEIKDGD